MAENPLLPHRKLQELYALMVRCRGLERKAVRPQDLKQTALASKAGRKPARVSGVNATAPLPRTGLIAREAVLAATSLHLVPGDLLYAEAGDRAAQQLAPVAKQGSARASRGAGRSGLPYNIARPLDDVPGRLPLCAALARGLQAAAVESIVLAYASAGALTPGWIAALEWAQSAQLPLLLVCTDATGGVRSGRRPTSARRDAGALSDAPLSLAAMNAVAQRLRLPVMPVDGEDAVAIYRVMQECTLRARMGGGPAVLWALMTPLTRPEDLPRAQQPIPRLKSYMAVRGIRLA